MVQAERAWLCLNPVSGFLTDVSHPYDVPKVYLFLRHLKGAIASYLSLPLPHAPGHVAVTLSGPSRIVE